MSSFLVYTETLAGNRLIEALLEADQSVCVCVRDGQPEPVLSAQVRLVAPLADANALATLLQTLRVDCMIDAALPFSALSEELRVTCAGMGVRYLRLSDLSLPRHAFVHAKSTQDAVSALGAITGRALLMLEPQALEAFAGMPDFEDRLCPVLPPNPNLLQHCLLLGYKPTNILAMGGAFTREMVCAAMRQFGASVLVMRQRADAEQFYEQLLAARDVQATSVVIDAVRHESDGMSLAELMLLLKREYHLSLRWEKRGMGLFPLFTDLTSRTVLIVGGDMRAYQCARGLVDYCARVHVISAQFDAAFDQLEVERSARFYIRGDCAHAQLVLAMTGNLDVDAAVCEEAQGRGIPVYCPGIPERSSVSIPLTTRTESGTVGLLPSEQTDRQEGARLMAMLKEVLGACGT